jgi:hypothetical protein
MRKKPSVWRFMRTLRGGVRIVGYVYSLSGRRLLKFEEPITLRDIREYVGLGPFRLVLMRRISAGHDRTIYNLCVREDHSNA